MILTRNTRMSIMVRSMMIMRSKATSWMWVVRASIIVWILLLGIIGVCCWR
jgi:hypothetical protein